MSERQTFKYEEREQPVRFVETTKVKDGVVCDVYEFTHDASRDLGIVSVTHGCKTPKQRVVMGDRTIEGHLSGHGRLTVWDANGTAHTYNFPSRDVREVTVHSGEIMQWWATDSDLQFYEICEPPYAEGRFENLD